MHISNI